MSCDLYRHYNEKGELLYVGISLSAISRLAQHSVNAKWYDEICTVKIQKFKTREQAIAAEALAIKAESPIYNIARPIGSAPVDVNKMNKLKISDLEALLSYFEDSYKAVLFRFLGQSPIGGIACGESWQDIYSILDELGDVEQLELSEIDKSVGLCFDPKDDTVKSVSGIYPESDIANCWYKPNWQELIDSDDFIAKSYHVTFLKRFST